MGEVCRAENRSETPSAIPCGADRRGRAGTRGQRGPATVGAPRDLDHGSGRTIQQDLVGPAEFRERGDPLRSNDGTRIAIDRIRDTADGSDPVKPIGIVDAARGSSSLIETGPSLGTEGGLVEWAPDDTALYLVRLDASTGGPELLDPTGGPSSPLPWTTPTGP